MDDKSVSKQGSQTGRIGIRTGHTTSIIASVKEYLTQHPADYLEQVDTLPCNVAHRIQPESFKPVCNTATDTPEIRERFMAPEQLPI